MDFEHKSGIYMCTCKTTGKAYMGLSNDVKLRKTQHLSELRYNYHYNKYLQHAFNKYGENDFTWTILEYCDESILSGREIYWINYYNMFADGYNANMCGIHNRGYERTPEYREALSKILKESWANDINRHKNLSKRMRGKSNPMYGKTGKLNPAYGADRSGANCGMYGKKHTEHAKELNRQKHLGFNNKMSKAVLCIETNELFASQLEASRAKNCDNTTINKCCKGVKKTCGGYHWRYATEEEILKYTQNA